MNSPSPAVTEAQARELIHTWGALQDEHAGLARFLPILAEQGLLLKFKDNEWAGYEGFEIHQEMKRKFFDEEHVYNEDGFSCDVHPNETHVKSQMQWIARFHDDGAARSTHFKADLQHRWVMIRCPRRNTPVIQYHECLDMQYVPGYEPQGSAAQTPIPKRQ